MLHELPQHNTLNTHITQITAHTGWHTHYWIHYPCERLIPWSEWSSSADKEKRHSSLNRFHFSKIHCCIALFMLLI